MPNEAHDGRNVALSCQVFQGVLDCPKWDQAIINSACQLPRLLHHFYVKFNDRHNTEELNREDLFKIIMQRKGTVSQCFDSEGPLQLIIEE